MNNDPNHSRIPEEKVQTSRGCLYPPPKQSVQILFLVAAFFTALLLGWGVSGIQRDLSEIATGVLCFVFLLVFFLGYGLWLSMARALLLGSMPWPMLKVILKVILRKEKPASLDDLLPTKEKAAQMMVRIQKYSGTFRVLCWPIGIAGGCATMFMQTSNSSFLLFLLVTTGAVLYGHALSYFARRGYLPLPDE